jgi:hypothetical protein
MQVTPRSTPSGSSCAERSRRRAGPKPAVGGDPTPVLAALVEDRRLRETTGLRGVSTSPLASLQEHPAWPEVDWFLRNVRDPTYAGPNPPSAEAIARSDEVLDRNAVFSAAAVVAFVILAFAVGLTARTPRSADR